MHQEHADSDARGRPDDGRVARGHGEKQPEATERDGYSALTGVLRRDNYVVEPLVLAQQKEVLATLSNFVAQTEIGSTAKVQVNRDGQELSFDVKVGERPKP